MVLRGKEWRTYGGDANPWHLSWETIVVAAVLLGAKVDGSCDDDGQVEEDGRVDEELAQASTRFEGCMRSLGIRVFDRVLEHGVSLSVSLDAD